jgi:hypothetical protein
MPSLSDFTFSLLVRGLANMAPRDRRPRILSGRHVREVVILSGQVWHCQGSAVDALADAFPATGGDVAAAIGRLNHAARGKA